MLIRLNSSKHPQAPVCAKPWNRKNKLVIFLYRHYTEILQITDGKDVPENIRPIDLKSRPSEQLITIT